MSRLLSTSAVQEHVCFAKASSTDFSSILKVLAGGLPVTLQLLPPSLTPTLSDPAAEVRRATFCRSGCRRKRTRLREEDTWEAELSERRSKQKQ